MAPMGVATETSTGSVQEALAARSMCEAFQITAAANVDRPALRTIGNGTLITFAEYAEHVTQLAGALHALGVRRGDTVGFMLANRPEFHLLDTAAMHLGATAFSIYNTSSPEQIAYLLGDAGNRVFVVQQSFADRALAAMQDPRSSVEHLIVLDADAGTPEMALTLHDLQTAQPPPAFDFQAAWRAVEPGDVLTLIYTSGTTGPPKGVQLTHANQLAQSRMLSASTRELSRAGGDVISFLPLAHIADRGLTHYAQMVWGTTITTCPDPTQVFAHVADARPTRFGSVPRMWEKLKAALEAGFAAEPDPARRQAVEQALQASLQRVRLEQASRPVPPELQAVCDQADEQIFSKIRAKLGFDRCEHYIIGAAPAPREVFEFFAALGIEICEVWGMSELSCVATLVPRNDVRFGTVGKPLPGLEVKLAEDGELLVRGELVMAGYRNQPQKTAETIDPDGWLHTGDIATIDEDGFISIVDRKKELIINAAGKNMSPANIEAQLKSSSPLIGQAIAIGDARPYNVALLVLDPDAAVQLATERGIEEPHTLERLSADEQVLAEVTAGVARANERLSRVEQIKRFKLLPCDWPPAGDELTPTMKLKRKPIAVKYAAEIEALYAGA
jgi:long-subunit acyl-CoA synthetase (AMP-forming)